MVFDNKNQIPVFGIIYIAFLIIVLTGYMFKIDYGWIGILATIVVIIGAFLLIVKLYNDVKA